MNDTMAEEFEAGEFEHRPVLLDQVIEGLKISPDGLYVDGTFGRGGHAAAILERLGPQGRLLAMDKDPQAIATAQQRFGEDPRFDIVQGSFAELGATLSARNLSGKVNGVLLDLGVSSPQLDDAERGFSFRRDGDLDMRMNPETGISAAQWLKDVGEQELAQVFKTYGEERYAKRIARAVIRARQEMPLIRTRQLAGIIAEAHPNWEKGKDPATRCFQAIRIFINGELDDIKSVLPQAVECLAKGGRLVVISFHSLEDRIVKRFIREQVRGDEFPRGLPIPQSQLNPKLRAVGKAIKPDEEELGLNPRARSSVLRIAEKLQ